MSDRSAAVRRDLAPEGVLRAAINLGNPVLATGTPEEPSGVTVDLAREIASRLGVEARLRCFDAARKSFEALHTGVADIGFLAIEPEREADLAFTAPYALIEGVYVVPEATAIAAPDEVDRHGIRVGVKRGSAYDLHLTRNLAAAEVVRGEEGVDVFADQHLEVGAGIRQPTTTWADEHPGHRILEPAFMQIRQAVATTRGRDALTIDFLRDLVEELKASGFVSDALTRSGRIDVTVAPPS
ncbi:MAG TPA: transporter substrate-binding domain-containing protein [Nocardioides sp.]|uniref:transporter substrate-binding domain-containing protein n=1 Tax=Nocardioides sp. TaxID=35761 RepID=UPI002F4188F4